MLKPMYFSIEEYFELAKETIPKDESAFAAFMKECCEMVERFAKIFELMELKSFSLLHPPPKLLRKQLEGFCWSYLQ